MRAYKGKREREREEEMRAYKGNRERRERERERERERGHIRLMMTKFTNTHSLTFIFSPTRGELGWKRLETNRF